MHKHILIATDGSQVGASAVDRGCELAGQLGARITLLTVTEFWSALEIAETSQAGVRDPIAAYDKLAKEHARKILEVGFQKAQSLGVSCETVHISNRYPAEAIVEEAKVRGCDLIVVGSHGRRASTDLSLAVRPLACSP